MAEKPRLIRAEDFHKALVDAGVVRDGERIARIVIDAQAGHLVTMHVQRFGDARLLDVVPTLDGVEIRKTPAELVVDTTVDPQFAEQLRTLVASGVIRFGS